MDQVGQAGQWMGIRKTCTNLAVTLDFHSVCYRDVLVHKTEFLELVRQPLIEIFDNSTAYGLSIRIQCIGASLSSSDQMLRKNYLDSIV